MKATVNGHIERIGQLCTIKSKWPAKYRCGDGKTSLLSD